VGPFDWLRRKAAAPAVFEVSRDGADLLMHESKGTELRVPLAGARAVRVVPLTGGSQHASAAGGWQVALSYPEGDRVLGKPYADWRPARDLAHAVCAATSLPLDELTERLFSRVGQFTVPPDGQ
jgi:hypothetical protein